MEKKVYKVKKENVVSQLMAQKVIRVKQVNQPNAL
jgi:hypothetical protein